ncbi:TnsA endonuclease N-terminal domain-containing protein [Shewanella avicenniae]|uniref:TnsA endonuclease N-terminal domain-containing protein n=1 Tax=Shewanella avicenniae TaxID=2814294 RepID=A0ABX7QSN0_9GAMM|nr:TnsA endonuclease N-terminal domain-containing protein [Shewanella avicenniae]QSX34467.1 TnsA endonuclease N-terminal domain-containing protein [Shewanella avicenniae]
MKNVIQPEINKSELNKIESYTAKLKREKNYKPWLTARNSHTYGQAQVISSVKFGRVHHFLSRGEAAAFFHFEANQNVIALYEQYPLPLNETMQIAIALNIVHPATTLEFEQYDGVKVAKTMTLDYLVQYRSGDWDAYNFKYASSLDPNFTDPRQVARTRAKELIERAYCEQNNISWRQLTEHSFDEELTRNLIYLRECFERPDVIEVSDDVKSALLFQFKKAFKEHPLHAIRDILEHVGTCFGLTLKETELFFQLLVYRRQLLCDLTQPLVLNRPLPVEPELEVYAN